jgi:FkbM family methyltransferase
MVLDPDEKLFLDLFFDRFSLFEVTLLDVGSSIGRYTDGFKAEAYRQGVDVMVHAFDPRNGTVAVGESVGTAEFSYLAIEEHSHLTHSPEYQSRLDAYCDRRSIPHVTSDVIYTTEVGVTTIDAFPYISPAFLKIDTEGHELPILRGAKQSLAEGKLYGIQFEYGGTWAAQATLQEAVDLLDGYDLFRYLPGGIGSVVPLTSFVDDYYFSGNFLALRKQ